MLCLQKNGVLVCSESAAVFIWKRLPFGTSRRLWRKFFTRLFFFFTLYYVRVLSLLRSVPPDLSLLASLWSLFTESTLFWFWEAEVDGIWSTIVGLVCVHIKQIINTQENDTRSSIRRTWRLSTAQFSRPCPSPWKAAYTLRTWCTFKNALNAGYWMWSMHTVSIQFNLISIVQHYNYSGLNGLYTGKWKVNIES